MKLEKVNDNQIRCTLNKADLADRQLKISELAYGTEKAKDLFRDMMQQASYEFGFEAEDIPLMIEAIPLSADCIVLIITKVEDPEELDTRFSNFAPSVHEDDNDSSFEDMLHSFTEGAENVLDLFKRLKEETDKITGNELPDKESKADDEQGELCKVFSFGSLDEVTRLANVLSGFYTGRSSLYKDGRNGTYLLFVTKSAHTREDFNKVCNIASEYGEMENLTDVTIAYLEEHGGLIIKDDALQKLLFN
ncbi:MAG: adaptor protein MecA [Lachnospiraceae bacterium]|nr:adaptor protein MecA [Lachnospiraceae bacterium]